MVRKTKTKTVQDCEIAEIVHTFPTLSDDEVNNIEGKITLEVSTKSLKNRI